MSKFFVPHRLKRIGARIPVSRQNYTQEMSEPGRSPATVHRMLRILLGNPWDDYTYINYLGQEIVARQNSSYFKLVNIRACNISDYQCRLLSSIHNPNIATIYDLYCDGDVVFQVIELLELSLAQLEIEKYELEEWEMATIIAEILNGIAYISSLKLSCKSLSRANIKFSLQGEIKLILEPDKLKLDHLHEGSGISQALLDFPLLAELMEEMMLSRYHLTPDDDKWSEDALDFLSCTLSGTLDSLRKHHFLQRAVSPKRLIPRIRFAFELSRKFYYSIGNDSLSGTGSNELQNSVDASNNMI